jgi:hypothetical protein
MKCRICRKEQASWSWQPLGPAENADCFALAGHHTRGFLIYKVCQSCKQQIQAGTRFSFDYKDVNYAGTIHHIESMEVAHE